MHAYGAAVKNHETCPIQAAENEQTVKADALAVASLRLVSSLSGTGEIAVVFARWAVTHQERDPENVPLMGRLETNRLQALTWVRSVPKIHVNQSAINS